LHPKTLARRLANLTLEKKASNVKIFDLRPLTNVTDFFVVCSADSDVQVKAVCDHLIETMTKKSMKPWHVEGLEKRQWVLLDFVDVVVHIFLPDVRDFYGLERLWGDAEIEEIGDVPKSKT
jgi:ribosome-associated protein